MRMFWFRVTGTGDFPFRMLALSNAWPADEIEAHRVVLSCPTVAPQQSIKLHTHKPLTSADYALWKRENWPITAGGSNS